MCWSKIWSFLKRKYCASKTTQKLFKSKFWKSVIAETFEILDLQTFLVMAILLPKYIDVICIWECKSNLYNCILYRQEICNFNELYGWCFRKTTDTSCLFFAQNFLGISLKLLSFFRVSPLWVLGFFDYRYYSISTVSISTIFDLMFTHTRISAAWE